MGTLLLLAVVIMAHFAPMMLLAVPARGDWTLLRCRDPVRWQQWPAVASMHLRGGRCMRPGAGASVRHQKKRKEVAPCHACFIFGALLSSTALGSLQPPPALPMSHRVLSAYACVSNLACLCAGAKEITGRRKGPHTTRERAAPRSAPRWRRCSSDAPQEDHQLQETQCAACGQRAAFAIAPTPGPGGRQCGPSLRLPSDFSLLSIIVGNLSNSLPCSPSRPLSSPPRAGHRSIRPHNSPIHHQPVRQSVHHCHPCSNPKRT
jgi:hypothetical protein